METVGDETLTLPLFEQPLGRLSDASFSTEETESQGLDIQSGSLHIVERVTDGGQRDITVDHVDEGERQGHYRFRIEDRDQRICRYSRSDTPPWSVYCAINMYGYYSQTAPTAHRKFVFDLLHAGVLELIRHTEMANYDYLKGLGWRTTGHLLNYVFLSVLEYQLGVDGLETALDTLKDAPHDDTGLHNPDTLEYILKESGVEHLFFPTSPRHPATSSFLDQFSTKPDTDQDSEHSVEDSTCQLVQYQGTGEYQDHLYVTLLGSDAIERFSFHITDKDAKECVVQSGKKEDFPPYAVIEQVSKDYDITNLPKIHHSDGTPLSEVFVDIDRLVRRTLSIAPRESPLTQSAYEEYLNELELSLLVSAAFETAPDIYEQGLEQMFSQLGIKLTAENVLDMNYSNLDQITIAATQPMEGTDSIEEFRSIGDRLLDETRIEDRRDSDSELPSDAPLLRMLHEKDISYHSDI